MKNTPSLKKNAQFRHVYNKGRSLANRHLILYICRNGLGENRLGLSVSKKVGKAVIRNRVKRIIKEGLRPVSNNVSPGFDLVFIARPSCKEANFKDIERSVSHLLYKHGIL